MNISQEIKNQLEELASILGCKLYSGSGLNELVMEKYSEEEVISDDVFSIGDGIKQFFITFADEEDKGTDFLLLHTGETDIYNVYVGDKVQIVDNLDRLPELIKLAKSAAE